jgi:hypothetical protein
LRCGRCGNDNAGANRFCGMCGAPLVEKPQPAGLPSSAVSVSNIAPPASKSATPSSPVAVKSFNPIPTQPLPPPLAPSHPEPRRGEVAITGPSFLGLNVTRQDSSPGYAPLQGSSSSLDYLLEDEEEPKGRAGKLILVIALALAAGVGYLRWKRGGFEWLNLEEKKAAVTTPAPDSSHSAPDPGDAPAKASTPNSIPTPAASAPVTPVPTDGTPSNPDNAPSTNASSPPAAPQSAPPGATPDANSPASPAVTSNGSGAVADASRSPGADASKAADSDQQSDEEEPPAPTKAVTRKPAIAKPSAARPVAAVPNNSVAEAERYIYGRGVGQDCERGLRLLKPSAQQANPNAMISLGALYSTGTCTPRDLPTAYRWFALALHKQPDNQALQNDLQKLWSQMTQPERQLAIKLSQ